MTKQHIFGRRLLRLLDGAPLGSHLVIERLSDQTTSKRRDGNIWSKQLRCVCATCNEGWMRRLEESTFTLLSSLILGAETIPEPMQQTLAARFAHMVMVAAMTIPDGLDPISRDDREYLRLTHKPPARWVIFLARANVSVALGQYYNANVFGFTESQLGHRPEVGKSYIATFVLGKLCVHLLTRAPTGYEGYIGATLARLWPLSGGDVDLTQSSLLDARAVHELAESIRKQSLIDKARLICDS
jgi:hypothetical protein